MTFSANFTAIDFETANRRRDSACQLAAVRVRDGKMVDERMWMIRPDPFFFSPGNIRIHGIHPGDVEHEPTFGDLWDQISDFLADDCLIAHNAPFDIGVMIGCLERHRLVIPEMNFSCTRLVARQTWPDRRRYGLKPLSDWLGVQFKHHDALEDSRACAKVLLAAGIAKQAESVEDLEIRLRIIRGKAGTWGVSHASRRDARKKKASSAKTKTKPGAPKRTLRRASGRSLPLPINPFGDENQVRENTGGALGQSHLLVSDSDQPQPADPTGIDWQRLAIRAEFIQPLRGRQIVIYGRLNTLSPEQAVELTNRSGGTHQPAVDAKTNCVVIGSAEVDQVEVDAAIGNDAVEVLNESEFLRLIGLN